MDYMTNLCELIDRELEQRSNVQQLDAKTLEWLDMLLHCKKSIVTIKAMEGKEEGYSQGGSYRMDGQNPYNGDPYSNNSYRGSYDGGSYRMSRSGYSRGDEREQMIRMMEQAMDKAPDQRSRQAIQNAIHNLKHE